MRPALVSAAALLLAVVWLAYAVTTRERPLLLDPIVIDAPTPLPFDPLAYRSAPDSAAYQQMSEGGDIYCVFVWRIGQKYRWPADAPWLEVGDIPGHRYEIMPGPQWCGRFVPYPSPIT